MSLTAGAGERPDVVTVGEAMVAFRADGPVVQGGTQTTRLAGSESNVAIGLARLGHRVEWAGRVGADAFGDLVLRELRAEGVGTTHAAADPERPTGLMFVTQRTADLSSVDYRRSGSAGSALGPADVADALTTAPRFLHLTGITPALSDSARESVTVLVDLAVAAGVRVSLDVNYRSRLWTREQARAVLAPLSDRAFVVIASEDELDLVSASPATEADLAASLLSRGVHQVAVKRGVRGASVYTADARQDASALAVTAVDPMGAGDAFCAGYLSGLLDGLDPAGCLGRGTVGGAFVASSLGDWEGAPTRAELDLLHDHVPGESIR